MRESACVLDGERNFGLDLDGFDGLQSACGGWSGCTERLSSVARVGPDCFRKLLSGTASETEEVVEEVSTTRVFRRSPDSPMELCIISTMHAPFTGDS